MFANLCMYVDDLRISTGQWMDGWLDGYISLLVSR